MHQRFVATRQQTTRGWRRRWTDSTLACMTDRQTARRGPRPLGLHLWAAAQASVQPRLAWPWALAGSFPWMPALAPQAAEIRAALEAADGAGGGAGDEAGARQAFEAVLDREARRRADRFLTGLESYRTHPYRRSMPEPPCIWREGTTRLLDYGVFSDGAPHRGTLLVIPSLVNRYTVLDLNAGASLARSLATAGFRPLIVDWDAPGAAERGFTLTDYIAGRLEAALDVTLEAGGPVSLLGYCMGGLLATALAQRRGADITAMALLATPWDFHAATGGPPPLLNPMAPWISEYLAAATDMPVDMLQGLFFSLDPMQGWNKFRRFAATPPDSPAARQFVALEDWANDGVALAGPVARECLLGWYMENTPARDAWHVAGQPVRAEEVTCPALIVVPARDRIVPPESALALAAKLPNSEILTPPSGHVGMVVGARAEDVLWKPLTNWLADKFYGSR